MIVNHLTTYLSGGAAGAAVRLHESLLAAGVDSRIWSTRAPSAAVRGSGKIAWATDGRAGWQKQLARAAAATRKLTLKWRLARQLAGRRRGLELFTLPWQPVPTRLTTDLLDCDVIQLHWVAKMIDYESFFDSVPSRIPIVWTLHDMNPFTGGCHYAGGCQAFRAECGHCPQLGRPGQGDLAGRSFQAKLAALQGRNLHIVTPSHWLERQARQSRLFADARSFQTIH